LRDEMPGGQEHVSAIANRETGVGLDNRMP